MVTVTITCSIESCILPVLLSAGHTAQMNAVADSFAMSLYPDLTTNNEGLLGWCCTVVPQGRFTTCIGRDSREAPLSPHIVLRRTNAPWQAACGRICPANKRRLKGMRGVGFFHWNADVLDSRWQEMAQLRWGWRIATKCMNPNCMYRE